MSESRPPTERQLEIASAMLRYHDSRGDWPTQREIADTVGIRSTNVSPYLTALLRKGIAKRLPQKAQRNIAITKQGEELIRAGWQPSLFRNGA